METNFLHVTKKSCPMNFFRKNKSFYGLYRKFREERHIFYVFKFFQDDLNLGPFAIIEKRTAEKFLRKTRSKLHMHNN